MAIPTTAVLFSGSTPAAPPGDQDCIPLSDGGSPAQIVAMVPRQATTALRGTVKPDGTTITIDADGTIHAVAASTGGTGGGGTGGTTTSGGGGYVCVTPSGATDGSNTQYTIPATVLAGTAYIYVRNGVVQPQLGANARYAVQGAALTTSTPLQSDDWHEFYFVRGSASSESGGGGSVTPSGAISAWPMNEGSGLVFHDVSGNGNDATVSITPGFSWASNAGFPGTTPLWANPTHTANVVSANPSLTNFDGTTPFSLAAWVKITGAGQQVIMSTISIVSSPRYQGWELTNNFGAGPLALYLGNSPSNRIIVAGSTNITDGARHYVVATYDGSGNASGVRLYVDGAPETLSITDNSLGGLSAAGGLPVDLAQRPDGTQGLAGVVAFAEIWPFVIAASVAAAFNSNGPQIN